MTAAGDAEETWLVGPRVAARRSSASATGRDVLLSGGDTADVVGIDPRGTLPALDDAEAFGRARAAGTLRPPYLFRFRDGGRIAAYDTDLDGRYDLRLIDLDGDGFADVRETAVARAPDAPPRAGDGWAVQRPVHVPWLRAAHVAWADAALAERAVAALRFLAPASVEFAPPDAHPPVERDVAALASALDDAATSADGRARAIELGRRLWAQGRLGPALRAFATPALAQRSGAAPPPEELDGVLRFVGAQLWLEGRNPRFPSAPAPSWEALAREHAAFLAASHVPRAERSLSNPTYVAELEAAGGAPFTAGNTVDVLVDGPASWAVREPLLAGARRELLLAAWAIYDDPTGRAAVDALLAAAARGVDVRVVVDGQTSALPPYRGAVARLASEGERLGLPVAVTRWRDPARPFDGMHRKLLIVDGTDLVIGGLNFGDAYSHRNPADTRHWRDTDVRVRGPAVAAARALFGRRFGLAPGVADAPTPPAGTERVAVVDHAPGDDDPVLRSLLKAFDGARTSIDLENAYVVRIPSIEAALADAVRRGVRVRVLTNSATSIDEPIVAHGVARSAGVLADLGCEVHLRRGTTLHSKFATVDGLFAQVGSYNLHPRSHRLEGEAVVNVLGAATARRLEAVFERDLEASDRVRSFAEVVVPADALGRIAWVLCPDLL